MAMSRMAALVSLTLLLGCSDNQSGNQSTLSTNAIVPFEPEGMSMSYSGPTEPVYTVLRSAEDWSKLWIQLNQRGVPGGDQLQPSAAPPVDFSRYALVVAALGRRSDGCCSIEMLEAAQTRREIVVKVTERKAGAKCLVTDMETRPFALGLIPAESRVVRFEVSSLKHDCG